MKIAHLSKPWLPVPSSAYGAIEKMVAELININYSKDKVYLFAPGGSIPNEKIELISLYSEGQGDRGLDRNTELAQATHCVMKSEKLKVDLIHAHSVDPFLGLTPFLSTPNIFTFYSNPTPAGKILSEMAQDHTNFTFLSRSHRKSFPWIKSAEVVYFGVNLDSFPFAETKEDYLAFVGSINDKKGILEAIEIAKQSKMQLKIAAKIKSEDMEFYEKEVRSRIKSLDTEFLGEVNNDTRNQLLKRAKAMLFPIKWEEPFGMVMIESMAVGTPVIAFNKGSVPEVIDDGVTGFVVENVSQAVKAIEKLDQIAPVSCRKHIEEKFNINETADKFNLLYSKILSSRKQRRAVNIETSRGRTRSSLH